MISLWFVSGERCLISRCQLVKPWTRTVHGILWAKIIFTNVSKISSKYSILTNVQLHPFSTYHMFSVKSKSHLIISEDSLRIKIHKSLILRFRINPSSLFLFLTHHRWVINMSHPLNRLSSALRVISSFGMKKKKTKNVF